MNVTRFEPWSLINLMHRDLDQIASRRLGLADDSDNGSNVSDWVPAVDIVEEKERFVLRADVPGVSAILLAKRNGVEQGPPIAPDNGQAAYFLDDEYFTAG